MDYVDTIKLENGKVTLNGVPFIFGLLKSTYYMEKELEKVLGEEWKRVMYECGLNESRDALQSYIAMSNRDPKVQKLIHLSGEPLTKFLLYQYNKLGIGRLELITEDSSKSLMVLRLHFSPEALTYLEHEKSKEPVCYEALGNIMGGAEFIYPGISGVETKCLAKGDPYCEFLFRIPKKRW
jgi:predicted hydrocarbon binding protein